VATVIRFLERNIGKGTLADQNIKAENIEYDCALPQSWVNAVSNRFTDIQLEEFGNIASHFVYVYDNSGEHREEYVMPLTKTGCKILGKLATYI
jgi:hypothetical protein